MTKSQIVKPLQRILRRAEVQRLIGLGNTQLSEHIKRGEFPRPIKITESGRAVGWIEAEVHAWLEARIEARDQQSMNKDGE